MNPKVKGRLMLAAHQPDLLPYSGFWAKMHMADVFDVAIHDQFQDRGYQRRVTMRHAWASVPLVKPPSRTAIKDVYLADGAMEALWDVIQGRYRNARFWKDRSGIVRDWLEGAPQTWLWEFNLHLIVQVRELLGIVTPLVIVEKPEGNGLDGILDVCRQHRATEYLSGQGGRAYMGEDAEERMRDAGVHLLWVDHTPWTPDSVLTPLFDEEDVVNAVLYGRTQDWRDS